MNLRGHYYFMAGIVALMMLGSLLLIPRDSETALMFLKDKEFDAALEGYKRQLDDEGLTPTVVMPLTKLYLQYGRIDDAVTLMERYVERYPEDLKAREMLGTYYMYAQRPDDYVVNLERMTQQDISEEHLRELSRIYNFQAQIERQVDVLQTLVRLYPNTPQDFFDLARLQAALNRYGDAAASMGRMAELFPDAVGVPETEFRVHVLLDAGESQSAFAVARGYLERSGAADPTVAAQLSGPFAGRGHQDLALKLVEPYREGLEAAPVLLAEYMRLLAMNGRQREAYTALVALWRQGRLPEVAYDPLISIALQRGEIDTALKAVFEIDPAALPDWLMVAVAETALSVGRTEAAQELVARLGESFLVDRPVLAARLALLRGDEVALRRWVRVAERRRAELSTGDRVDLAKIYVARDQDREALALADALVRSGAGTSEDYRGVAQVYVGADAVDHGLALFDGGRAQGGASPLDAGWAVLATHAGRDAQVVAWLDGLGGDAVNPRLLRDIQDFAAEANGWTVALAAAERLYRHRRSTDDLTQFQRVLVLAAHEGEALAPLRPLLSVAPPAAVVDRVRTALRGAGAPVLADGLQGLATAEATAAAALVGAEEVDLTPPAGPLLVDLRRVARLVADGTPLDALPLARALVPGGTVAAGAYLATLSAATGEAGSPTQRVARAEAAVLQDPQASSAEREGAILTLLRIGAYGLALPAAEQLAADQGGPWLFTFADAAVKAGQADRLVAFLKRDLDRADLDPPEIEERLFLLTEHASEDAQLPFLRRYAMELGETWLFAYEDLLDRLGRTEELADHLERRLATADDDTQRRQLTFRLLDLGRKGIVVNALKRLAAGQEPDGQDLQMLLFLWGPRPPEDAWTWLEAQARRRGDGAPRAAWVKLFTDLGQPARGLALVSAETVATSTDAPLLDAVLDALAQAGQRDRLAAFLRHEITRTTTGKRLQAYAQRALTEGLLAEARLGFERQLAADPGHAAALRGLGHATYLAGDFDEALGALTTYLRRAPGTWEDHFYLAEMLTRRAETVAAQSHYQQALAALQAVRDPTFALRRTRAMLLFRTGRTDEARDAFRLLLAERPADEATRAEFLDTLIATRRLAEAEGLMAAKPAAPGGAPGETPAQRRGG